MKKLSMAALLSIVLAGCQSLQQDIQYTSERDEAVFSGLAEMIVVLDKDPHGNAAARKRITELEKSNIKDRNFEGRLSAWSGRLFLIEGKRREAQAQFKKAENLFPGSVEGRVLGIRLEQDPEKRRTLCEEALAEARGGGFLGRQGEFQIELGRAQLELKNYPEAAAAFDSAFPLLSAVYRNVYGEDRQKAWQLRNLDPEAAPRTAEISLKRTITWEDAVELSSTETGLLLFISGGENQGAAELFRRLADRSIIPPTQDMAETNRGIPPKAALYDTVLRSGAAWYLWRLLAENRADQSLLTRYSSRYAERSPIPDLNRDSIFFDSILGCIERQFMALTDGRNFNGAGSVNGAEFLLMLKKIK
ncbi:MAG: hypothetical protein LBP60_07745 [Spirochaetaceae bacterium]|jgi:tetratricopeptide (TPR) repeat protein|nr:hypothetical protein [Spirochaetaceae bacterium]